jgi:Domain of unknown function (DUF4440)
VNADLDDRLAAWTAAELSENAGRLTDLPHPDFIGVGPSGFILTRNEWAGRFSAGLHYTAFAFTPDQPTRYAGDTAVIVGTQAQTGSHAGRRVNNHFRVTLGLTDEPLWRLLNTHLSLRHPPQTPA